MNKFFAIGLDSSKSDFINALMELGCTELNSQESKLADEEWAALVSKEGGEADIAALETKLNAVDNVLKTLDSYDTAKKPLFKSRRGISASEFASAVAAQDDIQQDVDKVLALSNHLKELQANQNKIETAVVGLTPWAAYQVPLEIQETRYTNVVMGIVPADTDVNAMRDALAQATDKCELEAIGKDDTQQYLSLVYFKEAEDDISEVLKQYSFNRLSFKDMSGTVAENLSAFEAQTAEIAADMSKTESELSDMVAAKDKIQVLRDYLATEQDKAKAIGNLLRTGRTFYVDGWVPASCGEALNSLAAEHECYCEITEPDKEEDTPVLVKNNSIIEPVESITDMYSTPNCHELDPTPIYAFFFACFFGIMFADMCYGIILTFFGFFCVKKYKLEGTARKLLTTLGYCGIFTFIWGALFGGFLGNMISVVAATFFHKEVAIKPLWFDPISEPMKMLAFSCIFGVFHLFVGMFAKAVMYIKEGKILEAINDTFIWYVFIIGLGLLLFGGSLFSGATTIGKWMAIVGAVVILILPVFINKGIGKAVGLWNLYGTTSYLSDILSYSRLLALCLAGAVISQVFNTIAGLAGGSGGIIGVVLFVLISIVAHVFNFAISALGAFVHSARLQYVELFGKFFEGGGKAFNPFAKKTKYVKIIKEEN